MFDFTKILINVSKTCVLDKKQLVKIGINKQNQSYLTHCMFCICPQNIFVGRREKEVPMLLKEAKKILSDHKKDLSQLGVRALSLFGSVAKNKAAVGSDIDILVDFDSKKGLFGFMGLKNYLEELLDCDVDLVTKNALHPALKKKILHEAKHVF